MKKALLLNLKNKFSLYSIVDSNTFEPTFGEIDNYTTYNVLDYDLIAMYQEEISNELVKQIRQDFHFHNRKLLVLSDHLDIISKKQILQDGADFVELLPENEDDFLQILKNIALIFTKSSEFNAEPLQAFQLSIEEIIQTMAMFYSELVETYLSTTPFHYGDVSAVMSLAGEKKGAIMISFSENLARMLISSIMAVPEDDLQEEDIHDGVGEMINMIAGGAKARLGNSDSHFLLSAPTIITGSQHRVYQQKDLPCVVMVYKIDDFYFSVQLCMMSLSVV